MPRMTKPSTAVVSLAHYQYVPLVLLVVFVLVSVLSFFTAPAGALNWFMELAPAIIGIAVLLGSFRVFPFSQLVYVCVFFHALILLYGGHYTYAETPLGNWAQQAFELSRNHYDRIGHLALGFFPALTIREVLLRKTPLQRGGWLTFIVLSIVLAIGAFWELLEWWLTLLVASDVGTAFLGSQGDIWDAQWDMFLAMVGAVFSLLFLSRWHDESIKKYNLI
jgi:putative membrane protein